MNWAAETLAVDARPAGPRAHRRGRPHQGRGLDEGASTAGRSGQGEQPRCDAESHCCVATQPGAPLAGANRRPARARRSTTVCSSSEWLTQLPVTQLPVTRLMAGHARTGAASGRVAAHRQMVRPLDRRAAQMRAPLAATSRSAGAPCRACARRPRPHRPSRPTRSPITTRSRQPRQLWVDDREVQQHRPHRSVGRPASATARPVALGHRDGWPRCRCGWAEVAAGPGPARSAPAPTTAQACLLVFATAFGTAHRASSRSVVSVDVGSSPSRDGSADHGTVAVPARSPGPHHVHDRRGLGGAVSPCAGSGGRAAARTSS